MLKVGVPRFTRVPQLLVYNLNFLKNNTGDPQNTDRRYCYEINCYEIKAYSTVTTPSSPTVTVMPVLT